MNPIHLSNANPTLPLLSVFFVLFLFLGGRTTFAAEVEVFVPFDVFLKSVAAATYDEYSDLPSTKVSSKEAFERMRAHILETYYLVEVEHSFVLGETGHTDCVDMRTQPSLRRGDSFLKIAGAPEVAIFKEDYSTPRAEFVPPMLNAQTNDKFGNRLACPVDFIPMLRVELEELVTYAGLRDFFNKFGKAGTNNFPQAIGDKS
ncbi:MAG: hypothetical protein JKY67_06260 [Pseudomonadales bacterium]|nr:hypothetical protein [Pseudomonadales bacterium]